MVKQQKGWQLDSKEVSIGSSRSTLTGRRGKWTKQPSIMDDRSVTVHLIHVPTNIEVFGEISTGHYSNQELKSKKKKLEIELFFKLEEKVAKRLRKPGFLPRKLQSIEK